ncbi:MAG: tetratricopeptide repeat protein [Candidatus Aminicenantales bacterium]
MLSSFKVRHKLWFYSVVGFFALGLFLPGNSVCGQESVIKGQVLDKQNKPLANVEITFTDVSRGTRFALKTKKDGSYFKVGIPPAIYNVRLELEGYFPFESQVRVELGQEHNFNFSLEKVPPKIEDNPDFKEGMKHFEAGDFEAAAAAFKKTVDQFPPSVEANYNLAISYLRLEKTSEAINILEKIVSLRGDVPELYLALEEAYFRLGESEKAETLFRKALELQPNNYRIYYDLGIIYYKNDRLEEAIASFEKAKTLNPEFSSTYYQEGLAFIKQGNFPRAIEALEKFLQLEPEAKEASQVRLIIEELKKK